MIAVAERNSDAGAYQASTMKTTPSLHSHEYVTRQKSQREEAASMTTRTSSISPDHPDEVLKTLLAIIVEHAGADFVGVQNAQPEHRLPAYVLFNHPRHRSTLAVRLDNNFGTDAILRRLAECDQRFAGNG